jgi:hypothetical protein
MAHILFQHPTPPPSPPTHPNPPPFNHGVPSPSLSPLPLYIPLPSDLTLHFLCLRQNPTKMLRKGQVSYPVKFITPKDLLYRPLEAV